MIDVVMSPDRRISRSEVVPRFPGYLSRDTERYMSTQPVFDIPVYRLSHNDWVASVAPKPKVRALSRWSSFRKTVTGKVEKSEQIKNDAVRVDPALWTFNKVVGWLRLHAGPEYVWAELWWADRAALREQPRPPEMLVMGHLFTVKVEPGDTDSDVFTWICEALDQTGKISPFKGRFIDDERFRALGAHVQWRSIPKPANP